MVILVSLRGLYIEQDDVDAAELKTSASYKTNFFLKTTPENKLTL